MVVSVCERVVHWTRDHEPMKFRCSICCFQKMLMPRRGLYPIGFPTLVHPDRFHSHDSPQTSKRRSAKRRYKERYPEKWRGGRKEEEAPYRRRQRALKMIAEPPLAVRGRS